MTEKTLNELLVKHFISNLFTRSKNSDRSESSGLFEVQDCLLSMGQIVQYANKRKIEQCHSTPTAGHRVNVRFETF